MGQSLRVEDANLNGQGSAGQDEVEVGQKARCSKARESKDVKVKLLSERSPQSRNPTSGGGTALTGWHERFGVGVYERLS